MPTISVIVPVYKAEQYLVRCVESIRNQTFSDLEIILVDDGSPDNCGAICDEYARKDSRIKVIHRKNGGASAAKNSALEIACGEYIGFVDSDDHIHPQMYELLYYYAVTDNSDLVSTEKDPPIRKDVFDPVVDGADREIVTAEEVLAQFYQKYYGKLWMSYQIKLFHRSVFQNLRFRECIISEDCDLIPLSVRKAHQITIIPLELYSYTLSEGSVMRSGFSEKRYDSIGVWKRYVKFFYDEHLDYQKDYYATIYLYTVMEFYEKTKVHHPEYMGTFRKYIDEYKEFRPWLRKNCRFSKVQRGLLEAFPAMPELALKLYHYLTR